MKPIVLITCLLLFLSSVTAGMNRDSVPSHKEASLLCAPDKRNFAMGEKITYVLYYNWGLLWLSAGEVTFEIKERDGLIHLVSIGKTYPSYEWFYSVDNIYESFLDPETLLPVRTIKSLNEGNYYLFEEVRFDRLNGIAVTKRKRDPHSPLKTSIADITPCVHDLLSLVYAMRAKAFSSEDSSPRDLPVELYLDEKQYDLSLEYQGNVNGKEIKKKGAFDVMHYTPTLIEGALFQKGDEMDIYVSRDKNMIPLQIESPVSVGKIKAVIKEYEGLRFPLSAKTKSYE